MTCAVDEEDLQDTMEWQFADPVGAIRIYEDFLGAQIGGVVSAASVTLSRFLIARPEFVYRKRCVELGSGCAMVSMVAKRLGAERIQPTDIMDFLPHVQANLDLNQVEAHPMPLSWERRDQFEALEPYDIGFAAYCIYDRSVIGQFTSILAAPQTPAFLVAGIAESSKDPMTDMENSVINCWLQECEKQQLNLYLLSVEHIDPFAKKEEQSDATKNVKPRGNEPLAEHSGRPLNFEDGRTSSKEATVTKILRGSTITMHELCGGVWYVTRDVTRGPALKDALLCVINNPAA
eukprot:GEMP01032640.1.p1 GENE.GEMP01032640.1~~GEMP01032640.1.p1  ORF type:complete len:291 (+),score=54.92 GEMP01032640.1:59-931(+)